MMHVSRLPSAVVATGSQLLEISILLYLTPAMLQVFWVVPSRRYSSAADILASYYFHSVCVIRRIAEDEEVSHGRALKVCAAVDVEISGDAETDVQLLGFEHGCGSDHLCWPKANPKKIRRS
ncbi:hypothetical protein PIB30_016339 [Stylosanthes scabra]|uniref:Uncharacterized protein n=1 Tax=Stylosanthes scabra TaxID=79078 RepID=A0ABU6S6Q4_9FABA|nr:hypothetical protein [Stylosanthes scabra]